MRFIAPLLVVSAAVACAPAEQPSDATTAADRYASDADAAFQAGDSQAALALATRALVVRQAELGPDHPEVARSFLQLGDMRRALGQRSWAAQSYRKAIEILEPHAESHAELLSAARARLEASSKL